MTVPVLRRRRIERKALRLARALAELDARGGRARPLPRSARVSLERV